MPFDAALVQARPVLGDVPANTARVIEAIRQEAAELVVFPELFLSGYAVKDGFASLALDVDAKGGPIAQLVDACRDTGKHVIVGAPTRGPMRGVHHNSLLLIGPRGLVGRYDKVYLPTFSLFEEDHWFSEGTKLPVFEIELGGERVKLGLCICYDLFFPEITKTLALQGADLLVCSAASPTPSRPHFEAVFPARALETTCHLLFTNLAGAQDTALFWGGAQAWSARGHKLAQGAYDREDVTRVTLDMADVAEARRRRPVLRDTRADVLRRLLEAAE
jgi:predicted amidohydrolase